MGVELQSDSAFAETVEVIFDGENEGKRAVRLGLRWRRIRMRETETEGRDRVDCSGRH